MTHLTSDEAFHAILTEILDKAKSMDMSAKELAARVGITPETLSRMKSRGSGDFTILNKMAMTVGLRLALVPDNQTLDVIRQGKLF